AGPDPGRTGGSGGLPGGPHGPGLHEYVPTLAEAARRQGRRTRWRRGGERHGVVAETIRPCRAAGTLGSEPVAERGDQVPGLLRVDGGVTRIVFGIGQVVHREGGAEAVAFVE